MKNKLLSALLIGILVMAPMPAYAEDTDLEARVAALEERVAALEAQLSGSASQEEEAETSEYSLTAAGATLTYKRCEVGKDMWDNDAVILYFDFTNNSEETGAAGNFFILKAYQHDIEIDLTAFMPDGVTWHTELRPGAAPAEVGFAFKISDTSDIILQMKSFKDHSIDPIEFPISLN